MQSQYKGRSIAPFLREVGREEPQVAASGQVQNLLGPLEILEESGVIPVTLLQEKSGMHFVAFASVLEGLKVPNLIAVSGSPGHESVAITHVGSVFLEASRPKG